ncbi:hypothetical protein AWENTII_009823 [Aspergillus wentii]
MEAIHEQLRYIKGAPSVQMSFIPPDILGLREDTEKEIEEEAAMREEDQEEYEGGGSRAKNSRRRELERAAGSKGELFS